MFSLLRCLTLCLCAQFASPAFAEPVFVQMPDPLASASPLAPLRDAPSARGKAIAKLWPLQELRVLRKVGDWTEVQAGAHMQGFLRSDRLGAEAPAPLSVVAFTPFAGRKTYLRAQPSDSALPVAGDPLAADSVLQVLARDRDWTLVRSSLGVVGWVPMAVAQVAANPARFALTGQTVFHPRFAPLTVPGQVWLGAFRGNTGPHASRDEIHAALAAAIADAPALAPLGDRDVLVLADGKRVYGPLLPDEARQILAHPAFRAAFKSQPLTYEGPELAAPVRYQARNLTRFGTPEGVDPAYPVYDFSGGCSFASAAPEDGAYLNTFTDVLVTKEISVSWQEALRLICGSFAAAGQDLAHITFLDADRQTPQSVLIRENRVAFRIAHGGCTYDYALDMTQVLARSRQSASGPDCPVVLRDLRLARTTRLVTEAHRALEVVLRGTREGGVRFTRPEEVLRGTYAYDNRVEMRAAAGHDTSLAAACKIRIAITREPRTRTTQLSDEITVRNNVHHITYDIDLHGDLVVAMVGTEEFQLFGTLQKMRRGFRKNRGTGPEASYRELSKIAFPFDDRHGAEIAKEAWTRLARLCATRPG